MFSVLRCRPHRIAVLAIVASSLALLPAPHGAAQGAPDRARIEEALKGLNRGRAVREVAVSPDGKRLAWSLGEEIHVAPMGELSKPVRVTAAKSGERCEEGQMVWRPDSSALAFFSDCAKPSEQSDLYISNLDGGAAKRLTELKGYVHEPAFSPDGAKIAFLYVAGATRPAGALAAMKPPAGVIGEDNVEIQRVAYAAADAASPQAAVEASPADLHAYEFDWSPDSKSLAFVAAKPPGENTWWVAKLYTQPVGGEAKAILAPAEVNGPLHGLQIAVPRWSPDGHWIAFIGGLMSDQGSTGGDVWIVPAGGGEPRNLTPRRTTSASWILWDGDDGLYVSEIAGGNSQLVRLGLQGDRTSSSVATSFSPPIYSVPASVGDGRMQLSISSTADHALFVFDGSSFDKPSEIYAARRGGATVDSLAGLTQLTHFNDGIERAWGKTVSLQWTSDRFHVQGWLMEPKDYEPGRKYPLIVLVHGGPAAAAMSRWSARGLSGAAFSARGYFVLEPNPRGSYGQGEAFAQANRKDFGYGDLRDILAGVDAAEAKYPIDDHRVGLTGWSYGGFMTMFAVTQTNRFKAAVSGAGIANWLSYYGENSIDQWMIPYFGASVYDDPAVYAKASAIHYIKKAHTPTLVVVGDRDGECPAPQSYEFWHALRDQGVPTQLVVYPNEGHGFVDPAHRRDVLDRAMEWFAKYMPAEQ